MSVLLSTRLRRNSCRTGQEMSFLCRAEIVKRSFSSIVGARFSAAIRVASRQSVRMTSRYASTFAPAPATRSCTAWKSRMRMAV